MNFKMAFVESAREMARPSPLADLWHIIEVTLFSSYTNVLLVFVFLGILSGSQEWNPSAVFILNFLAIFPLASLLSFATEELAKSVGQTVGGLINASFGNAIEMIVIISGLVFTFQANPASPGWNHSGDSRRDPYSPIFHGWLHPVRHSIGTPYIAPIVGQII